MELAPVDTSIIILTKNGGDNFPRLLERIYSQQYTGSYEVIVIDSGSTDGTLEATRKYPLKLIEIKPEEFHHGRTRNLGADMAEGSYLVYITQDALPLNNDWLQKLTDNFLDARVAMVVGRQIPREDTKPPEKFTYFYDFPDFRLRIEPGAKDYYHNNNFVSDSNSAFRKDVLQRLRFSESIVMAEDKELAARILAENYVIIYDPQAAVIHSHDFSLKEIFERALDYGVSLRQGAGAIAGPGKSIMTKVFEVTGSKLRYLNEQRGWLYLPFMILYDFCFYLGFHLGKSGLLVGPMSRKTRTRHV
ncbi:MAG: glycosyltransferase family A protein [Dehalococcoidia bacterium]|jgi:rhamnosyltransferase